MSTVVAVREESYTSLVANGVLVAARNLAIRTAPSPLRHEGIGADTGAVVGRRTLPMTVRSSATAARDLGNAYSRRTRSR